MSDYQVLRGGLWYNSASDCRSASRNAYGPDDSYGDVGFRMALVRKYK